VSEEPITFYIIKYNIILYKYINIKMDLKQDGRMLSGFIWLRIGNCARLF
jgi:hypothetical protein